MTSHHGVRRVCPASGRRYRDAAGNKIYQSPVPVKAKA
jgi:hypothetical protein